ncbi:MAG: hypothetical protein R3C53_08215 [Pirellulaceae bacterium]
MVSTTIVVAIAKSCKWSLPTRLLESIDEAAFVNVGVIKCLLIGSNWRTRIANRNLWYRTLKLRVENPEASSVDLSAGVRKQLSQSFTDTRFRVTLHRARERFSSYLVRSIAATLQVATSSAVEDELAQLELLQYCQPFLSTER